MANQKKGTLYIGVTNDLYRRVLEHKRKITDGFTKKYNVDKLVYFEKYDYINNAILREKRLKKWERSWKIRLIQRFNPDWLDLFFEKYGDFCGFPPSRE